MANQDPTASGSAVVLRLPADHVTFLRGSLMAVHRGLCADLLDHRDSLRDPERAERECAALDRLLTALDQLVIVPDYDIQAVLRDLAEVIDRDNEYARVVAEHEALHVLREQVREGASR